jgi:hypothetical protein
VSEKQDGVLTAEEAMATLAMAEINLDEYAFAAAMKKAHIGQQPEEPGTTEGTAEGSEKPATEKNPEAEILAFEMWANSLVHEIGAHQMASVLAEKHGMLADQNGGRGGGQGGSTFLPGSIFDSTSAMDPSEHHSRGSAQLHHSQSVTHLPQNGSDFVVDPEVNVRRSQSQGRDPSQPASSKQDMMLTLPPLPTNGSRFDPNSSSVHSFAQKRRRKNSSLECTFSNKKLQSVAGFDATYGRETPRCLREGSTRSGAPSVKTAGGMGAIEALRWELRLAEEGLSRLDNIVEDNIAWVSSNCDLGSNFAMSSRAKTKCRKISTEKFADVLGNSALIRLDKAFKKWRMLNQFTDMMIIVRSYSKIKAIQCFGNAIGKIIYKLQSKVFAKWTRMVNMMRRFEQEAATVEIQKIVRRRLGKCKSLRRVAEIEHDRRVKEIQKIQKIVRGRLGRNRYNDKWREHMHEWALYYLQHWFLSRLAVNRALKLIKTRNEERRAATKIQKVARGRQGRRRHASKRAEREAREKAEEAARKAALLKEKKEEEKRELERKKREREEKKKGGKKKEVKDLESLPKVATPAKQGTAFDLNNDNDIDMNNFGADVDTAAVKLQAAQRGRLARQQSERAKQGKAAAAAAPPAEPALSVQEQVELDAAAKKLQAVSRGRMSRQNSQKLMAEKKKGGMTSFFSRKRGGGEEAEKAEGDKPSSAKTSSKLSGKLFGNLFGGGGTTEVPSPPKLEPEPEAVVEPEPAPEPVPEPAPEKAEPVKAKEPPAAAAVASAVSMAFGGMAQQKPGPPRPKSRESASESPNRPGSSTTAATAARMGTDRAPSPKVPGGDKTDKAAAAAPAPEQKKPNSRETAHTRKSSVVPAAAVSDAAVEVKSTPEKTKAAAIEAKPDVKKKKAEASTPPKTVAPSKGREPRASSPNTAAVAAGAAKSAETGTGTGSAAPGSRAGRRESSSPGPSDEKTKPSAGQDSRPSSKNTGGRPDKRSASPATEKNKTSGKQPAVAPTARPASKEKESPAASASASVRGSQSKPAAARGSAKSSTKAPDADTAAPEKAATKKAASGPQKTPATAAAPAAARPPSGTKKPARDASPAPAPAPAPAPVVPTPVPAAAEEVVALVAEAPEEQPLPAVAEEPAAAAKAPPVAAPSPVKKAKKTESPAAPPAPKEAEKAPPAVNVVPPVEKKVAHSHVPPAVTAAEKVAPAAPAAVAEVAEAVERPASADKPAPAAAEAAPADVPLDRAAVKSKTDLTVKTEDDKSKKKSKRDLSPSPSKGNLLKNAKATLTNLSGSLMRVMSPLVGSRGGSRAGSRAGSVSSLAYSDGADSAANLASPHLASSNSIDDVSPSPSAGAPGRLLKEGSRSALLNQDEKAAVAETRKMIDAQRKAAEYLTWAVVTIQRLARQYLAKKEYKALQALKKVIFIFISLLYDILPLLYFTMSCPCLVDLYISQRIN